MGEVLRFLLQQGVRQLYHFTDIRNLPLLKQAGALLSNQELKRRGLWPRVHPGGNSLSQNLDAYWGNGRYISLSYTPHLPMAYHRKRERHLCFLLIDLKVVEREGVVFTLGNATANSHQRGTNLDILRKIDFPIVLGQRRAPMEEWKVHVQAEVLVPHRIPLDAIRACAVVSEASKTLVPEGFPFPVQVRTELFADGPERKRPSFAWVYQTRLTRKAVTRENFEEDHPPARIVVRGRPFYVKTLVCSGESGCQLRYELFRGGEPLEEQQSRRFEGDGCFWVWHAFETRSLDSGEYCVRVSVKDFHTTPDYASPEEKPWVKWAELRFEVL